MFNKNNNLKIQKGGSVTQVGKFIKKSDDVISIGNVLVYLGEDKALRLVDNQIIIINPAEYENTYPPVGLVVKFEFDLSNVLILSSFTDDRINYKNMDTDEEKFLIKDVSHQSNPPFSALLCPRVDSKVKLINFTKYILIINL